MTNFRKYARMIFPDDNVPSLLLVGKSVWSSRKHIILIEWVQKFLPSQLKHSSLTLNEPPWTAHFHSNSKIQLSDKSVRWIFYTYILHLDFFIYKYFKLKYCAASKYSKCISVMQLSNTTDTPEHTKLGGGTPEGWGSAGKLRVENLWSFSGIHLSVCLILNLFIFSRLQQWNLELYCFFCRIFISNAYSRNRCRSKPRS